MIEERTREGNREGPRQCVSNREIDKSKIDIISQIIIYFKKQEYIKTIFCFQIKQNGRATARETQHPTATAAVLRRRIRHKTFVCYVSILFYVPRHG